MPTVDGDYSWIMSVVCPINGMIFDQVEWLTKDQFTVKGLEADHEYEIHIQEKIINISYRSNIFYTIILYKNDIKRKPSVYGQKNCKNPVFTDLKTLIFGFF